MKSIIIASLGLCLAACSGSPEDWESPDLEYSDDELNPLTGTLWLPSTVDGWTTIPVCWENGGADPLKAVVESAVEQQWEAAAKVRFTGWNTCASRSSGIRIRINDEGPHTKGLGRQLAGKSAGMVLNFTFRNWSTSCQSRVSACVSGIAVHEFGHALGIAHEQNRLDSPTSCPDDQDQGTNGDLELGNFDWNSTMNYCNGKWNNGGALSDTDRTRIADLYGGHTTFSPCFFPPCITPGGDGGTGLLRYGDLVAIGGRFGKYLRMDAGSDVKSDQGHIRAHEKWTIMEPFRGTTGSALAYGHSVALRSHTGKFLSARNGGGIGWASEIGPREIWEIARPSGSQGGSFIDVADPMGFYNREQNAYLYDGQGNPEQRPALKGGETWYMRGPVWR